MKDHAVIYVIILWCNNKCKRLQADAFIVTKDSTAANSKLEIIDIPVEINLDQIIPIGVLKTSLDKTVAQKFVDFITSDTGKACLKKYGFAPFE